MLSSAEPVSRLTVDSAPIFITDLLEEFRTFRRFVLEIRKLGPQVKYAELHTWSFHLFDPGLLEGRQNPWFLSSAVFILAEFKKSAEVESTFGEGILGMTNLYSLDLLNIIDSSNP